MDLKRKQIIKAKQKLRKKPAEDQFSTLTDDEVSVLFCFLCSDSGPPDFSDTEWLDLINKLPRRVHYKSVTHEEAQETLDRLKSRDYLWGGQDKITKDTKDETMYRIASIDSRIPFHYSSYNIASVYLRSYRYNRKPGEKSVISRTNSDDSLLIRRLQMNILTHVTMVDTDIYAEIHQILKIPANMLKSNKYKRKEFLKDLRQEGKVEDYRGRSPDGVNYVMWLWRYDREARPDIVRSCIGLHPHWDLYIIDNKAYRKQNKHHTYSPEVRCLLYCLLLTEKYQLNFKKQSHRILKGKIRERYFSNITEKDLRDLPDEITETHNGVITFKSDDIRHDVMYAFVTECLVEDRDLDFFLTSASHDVISEYCRSWYYKRSEGERCLYVPDIPEKMYDLLIDKLQLDIISHCTTSDGRIHDKISKRLGVPEEILKWDQEARKRYVECAKRGTQTVHHARGMIVGCAGAGKTTLLKRLLGCSEKEIKKIKSTEGLEVHEEIFDICDKTRSLKARQINNDDKNGEDSATNVTAKALTFFDFGGQCAYYACHQIYLTRRAFYVVVVDASKRLDQKVDKKVCDQDGSVFSGWTYGDYFVFWMKSIHTYCSSENDKELKPVVLIVATHWEEKIRQFKDKHAFMDSLHQQIPKNWNLSQYIVENNCYCIQFPIEPLHSLSERICDIANHQRWKETIPKEWAFLELEIKIRKHSERTLKIQDLTTKIAVGINTNNPNGKLTNESDMLRYYHDAGKVLYFNEEGLKEYFIIDVQWFIDAFKNIITDKLHFKGIPVARIDWEEFYRTGNLEDQLLTEIWMDEDKRLFEKYPNEKERISFGGWISNPRYLLYHKTELLSFMQRLGLMAVGNKSHYVPCMNRKEIEKAIPDLIQRSKSKTSVLIYRFSFLPFFLFFRLVVSCMQLKDWKILITDGTSCLYRNAALFSVKKYNIVLSVTESSIQLQIFHPVPRCSLEKDKTYKIQNIIEDILNDISGTFHRSILYERGFKCREDGGQVIAVDIEGQYVQDKYICEKDGEIICPLHPIKDQHFINTTEMSEFWNIRKP
ncbi:uncharacterized protein LOC134237423 [Saccostrea cucullata]|uniref:uncharacterized protein LOC134237423 n=1 Tax=Saccostrea cuccullata TaxID=36930 RepID=UPI002ED2A7F8